MTPKAVLLMLSVVMMALPCPAGPKPPKNPQPNLCDLDGGKWCTPCGQAGGPECPAEGQAGWLCCDERTGICVSSAINDCAGGKLGWCDNYTVDPAGAATCADAG